MKTICPIRALRGSSDPDIAPECMGAQCAWWHTYANGKGENPRPSRCALVSIADTLMDINLTGVNVYND